MDSVESEAVDEVETVIHGVETPTVPRKSSKRKAKAPKKPPKQAPKKAPTKADRLTSDVWDHFDRILAKDTSDGIQRAVCMYCKQKYRADPKIHGITNLRSHTIVCKQFPYREPTDGQQSLSFQPKRDGKEGFDLLATTFSLEAARTSLVEMVMIDELPFSFVEGIGFRNFCHVLQPKFKTIPSRFTVARDVVKIYDRERGMLMKVLKSRRVSLTTDTWTSIQNLNYMYLTAHFIDDKWKLHKRILNFCLVEDHKGDTIGKKVESCMLEWNIGGVFTLTVDNASSNSTAIKYLVKKTKDWEGTILEHEFVHVRCCAHILNLIVSDGLKELETSIACIRDVVRYVRGSPQRLELFKKCAEKEKIESKKYLCLDVPTRWNSTYLMLDAAQKFEKAFNRLHEDDSIFEALFKDDDVSEGEEENEINEASVANRGSGQKRMPSKKDWADCRTFVHFLRLFYVATKRFSGTLYVTSNVFFDDMFVIQSEIEKLIQKDDLLLSSMAISMKTKLEKYWGRGDKINLLLYVAVVPDPRKKLEYVNFSFNQLFGKVVGDEMEAKVKACLTRLYEDYAKRDLNSVVEVPNVVEASPMCVDDDFEDPHLSIATRFNSYMEERHSVSRKTDLNKYLVDCCEGDNKDSTSFDILKWWRDNSGRYKVLSQLAQDVLAFPISTVASESAFCTGGRILDPFRSTLSPKMVERLLCGQNWLLNNAPISLRKSMDAVEEYESYETALLDESESQTPNLVQVD